ncbi:hypothetical protein [Paenibacillus sp. YYML68]|uniref:hypothetical protein n=1 Tax=Paenibacillus sp. YYML68 TaxID=2909250 RepID=UPI002492F261|nr:hypothetical protein [Paenibacillus sp. YYML68]
MPSYDKAIKLLEEKITPLVHAGKDIQLLALYVAPTAPMAERSHLGTKFGYLKIKTNVYMSKGMAYILEEPAGVAGRAFCWIEN